ncbi:hypothetical protein ACJX0J_035673 [Zea mays]
MQIFTVTVRAYDDSDFFPEYFLKVETFNKEDLVYNNGWLHISVAEIILKFRHMKYRRKFSTKCYFTIVEISMRWIVAPDEVLLGVLLEMCFFSTPLLTAPCVVVVVAAVLQHFRSILIGTRRVTGTKFGLFFPLNYIGDYFSLAKMELCEIPSDPQEDAKLCTIKLKREEIYFPVFVIWKMAEFHFFFTLVNKNWMEVLDISIHEAHHDQFQIFLGIGRLMQKMSAIYITSVYLFFYLLHILKLHMLEQEIASKEKHTESLVA